MMGYLMHSYALLMLAIFYSAAMLASVFSDSQRTGHVAYLALLSKHHATGYALRLVHSMRHAHELIALLASCPAHLTALTEDVELASYYARPSRDRKLPSGSTGHRPCFARTYFASLLVVGGVSPFGDPGRMVQNLPHKMFIDLVSVLLFITSGCEPYFLIVALCTCYDMVGSTLLATLAG